MPSKPNLRSLLIVASLCFVFSLLAQDHEAAGQAAERAGRLREALNHYIAALQALGENPPLDSDQRLRERISGSPCGAPTGYPPA